MENKEFKEALVGFMELAIVIAKVSKDGVQVSDIGQLIDLIKKPEVAEKLIAAYNGIDKVPSELKEFGYKDAFELLPLVAPKVAELVQVIKA